MNKLNESPYDVFAEVYKQGKEAAKNGQTLQACEYELPIARKLWMKGYRSVKLDKQKGKEK